MTTTAASNPGRYLSRHRKQLVQSMLRVNHAGELGADRIYYGQMTALRLSNPQQAAVVQHLWDQEKHHLATFEELLLKKRASKSLLSPVWNAGGFALGFVSGLLGSKVAMATTVAIESVITDHYNQQISKLVQDPVQLKENRELIQILSKFRDDEQEHHDAGLENQAEQAPFYKLIYHAIQTLSKAAIKVAEKV
jgi:ubiquinone biosynthesis monooxygenase Coq7